ncbi:mycofactocin-coupled SDR family oxidoreductase [Mycobacterium sp. 1465703.0]|uniref:mycofactocin-coupled SDR family oxidoreductase n=1 Tax=Mycobacterium sp. 1465703.0 TaxID=1834078 RepID=UPI0007FC3509|nr:mycofactocin-coupled SDR family oxidoreductase [Mycobacterium sp. 1465703.0]OBI98424.1 3-ketoacyl-ACP reductase [Mycobacterium sp. 1465703.0]
MAGLFDGKVALITGAARGQGRSHAVRFAEEGADIIAVDLCAQINSVTYEMSRPEDLFETVNLVEKIGRRVVAEQADVRELTQLEDVVEMGVKELGRIDFVLANAGILPGCADPDPTVSAYLDAVNVTLNGVYFTIEAALPALLNHGDGGAIVITSSAAGFKSVASSFAMRNHGVAGYVAAKHGVVGLMRYYAHTLAEKNIRVNSVHPSTVATPMAMNEQLSRFAADHPDFSERFENLLPVSVLDPTDVTEAMVFLCGPPSRCITGVTLPVDAGFALK